MRCYGVDGCMVLIRSLDECATLLLNEKFGRLSGYMYGREVA